MTYNSADNTKTQPQIPQRPPRSKVNEGNIPTLLRHLRRWVCWRYKLVVNARGKGKWTKVPISAITLGNAKSNEPETWATLEAALHQYKEPSNNLDGIGFMLGDGWAGIDLDDCL